MRNALGRTGQLDNTAFVFTRVEGYSGEQRHHHKPQSAISVTALRRGKFCPTEHGQHVWGIRPKGALTSSRLVFRHADFLYERSSAVLARAAMAHHRLTAISMLDERHLPRSRCTITDRPEIS